MATIFIGKEFKYQNFLQNYIFSKYKSESIYFFDTIDFELEKFLNEDSLIVVNSKLYSSVAKIIATWNGDILEVRDNYLIPTKTILFEKNSFLIQHKDNLINVIQVADFIPEILISKEIFTIHIFNYDLETADLFIKPIFESFKIDYVIYQNEGGWCEVKFQKSYKNLIKQLKSFIPNLIFCENIFEFLKIKLEERGEKITFAESCTGGLIASYWTKIGGISKVFDGSVISYANFIKEEWLRVDKRSLEKFGAVSEAVVQQMLLGILENSGSDYAIAVSGIAGPTGATITKPVGTIFIGVGDKNGKFIVERVQLKGDREQIQYQTMMHSIRILIKFFNFF